MMLITAMAHVSIAESSLRRCHAAGLRHIRVGKVADTGSVLGILSKSRKAAGFILATVKAGA